MVAPDDLLKGIFHIIEGVANQCVTGRKGVVVVVKGGEIRIMLPESRTVDKGN